MREVPSYLVNFDLKRLPQEQTDILIVGSGIAGLFTALKVACRYRVVVITKEDPSECSTDLAQGGIAAALDEGDSAELHAQDTLTAGAGLSDPQAVRVLATEGPRRVQELIEWGIPFDREGGRLALGKEGAHSHRRILHAGGDATGAVIWQGLAARAAMEKNIYLLPRTMALDLLVADGRCYGALVLDRSGRIKAILAKATVLASGGAGRLYPVTTNPAVATGDGVAMAFRAGAEVMDLEFYQFHPTVLVHPGASGFLITEAIRGEGGILRNKAGERFMPRYHPLAELAPRDVVARAIAQEMARTGTNCVFLDVTHLDPEMLEKRFPTVVSTCRKLGLEVHHYWIPVAPAAHYWMGGVRTDLYGRTNLERLYAGGEVACTGVHGANRLASNSLLEALVFGGRIAADLLERNWKTGSYPPLSHGLLGEGAPYEERELFFIQGIMERWVGLVRQGQGLKEAAAQLDSLWSLFKKEVRSRREAEVRNLLLLSRLVVEAAAWRRESRGAHYRVDFPEPNPLYRKHLILARGKEARECPVS
ncbi:L-aspartate oxidase [Thermanaeromonas toyohensis ToBE]|uniref:L-aspartate oxidase n=1 Tax=Thermanaeromonas toyohensis ToBE TaxID=698762 RepID=A0A1W1W4Q6_9FIRM|nr:L-aspartate oxidase [Thermanaeromonas toyohensis]SMC00054.1 L-aspartate oxidase [Thermanaeromonas toyohensis ToBE]